MSEFKSLNVKLDLQIWFFEYQMVFAKNIIHVFKYNTNSPTKFMKVLYRATLSKHTWFKYYAEFVLAASEHFVQRRIRVKDVCFLMKYA